MIHRRTLVPIGIFLAIVLVGGGLWSLRPAVTTVSPVAGSASQADNTAITVRFNRVMRPASVEPRLAITPAVPGHFEWEPDRRTVHFIPEDTWERGEQVSVTLARGAQSRLFLPTLQSTRWDFTVARTRLAFLWPLDGPTDLYAIDPISAQSEQLTTLGTLLDFHVDPRSGLIAYSAGNEQGGSDLYLYDWRTREALLALPCENAACANVALAPGATVEAATLAYTRTPSRSGAVPEIWLLDLADGSTFQVSDEDHEALEPSWSSTGTLAYYDFTDSVWVFYEPTTGERITWANNTGLPGAWSPNGVNFVAPAGFEVVTDTPRGPSGELENEEVDASELAPVVVTATHLLSFNLVNRSAVDLSVGEAIEDLSPAFSPDGLQIAFGRRLLDPALSTGGRQLWLMGRDGAAPTAITERPAFKYNQFVWHPTENTLAFVRFDNVSFTAPPEVWIIDLSTRIGTRLVIAGFNPQWIP